jgi:hypothetical protein
MTYETLTKCGCYIQGNTFALVVYDIQKIRIWWWGEGAEGNK